MNFPKPYERPTRYLLYALCMMAVLVIVFPGSIFAQDVQQVERPKANWELANKFTSERLQDLVYDLNVEPEWLEKSEIFWYRFKTGEGINYYVVDPVRKTKRPMFDRIKLASELTKFTHDPYNERDLDLKELEFIKDNRVISFHVDSLKYEFELSTGALTFIDTVRPEDDKEDWKNFSPDSTVVVFARGHNLYLMATEDPDSVETQITFDGEQYYSYVSSRSDTITDAHTQRRRVRVGWSNDSRRFYVERVDYRRVGELWVINSLSNPRPTLESYRYPLPGEKEMPQEEIYAYDRETKQMSKVDFEPWIDEELEGFTWSDNSDALYFARRSRDYFEMDIYRFDPVTGETKVVIEERINGQILTRPLVVLNKTRELMWWSLRDGYGHFYLYDFDGNLKNQVTSGPYMVQSIAGIDTTGRVLYFTGNGKEEGRDPYYQHLYRVNFDGSGLQLLTPEDAEHSIDISESRKYFVDNFSRIDQEPKAVLRDSRGSLVMELETADISLLKEKGWKMPETFKAKAADGVTDLYGVMWKPFDFDPKKKYPIINYVYPGPQTESVPKSFTIRGRSHAGLAQLGFIVVVFGNRGGSPQRPFWYHEFGRGNLRDYGLADKKAVLEELAARHDFIDIDRVGIFGHSGGGFMTAAALLVYPDFFKVGVSSAGNHDNNVYNRWWSERHHGVKKIVDKDGNVSWDGRIPTNPELAKNLKGHILIVHGDIDNNVHPANSIRLVDALIKANKKFDFMIMPGQRHGFGKFNRYFTKMLWEYFAEHLLGDYRTNIEMFEDERSLRTVKDFKPLH